jgi:hypothetical protein
MNVVTPVPTNVNFHTANVHTEMARRDNIAREVIPNTKEMAESAKESGLGTESDKLRQAGQQSTSEALDNQSRSKDNGQDESAAREDAEAKQQQQKEQEQQQIEQQEIAELSARDREVRAHEQAHAAVGGQHAGAPTYEFKIGPDGKRYAVGGEVPIDISKTGDPEEDLRKMMQVRAAALAPAQPSPQDMRVAAEATAMAAEARVEIAEERSADLKQAFQRAVDPEAAKEAESATQSPDVDTDPRYVSRSLDQLESDQVAAAAGAEVTSLESDAVAAAAGAQVASLSSDDQVSSSIGAEVSSLESARPIEIDNRALRIADFYQQTSIPKEVGFNQLA